MKNKHLFLGGHYNGARRWVDDDQSTISLPVIEIESIKRAASAQPQPARIPKMEVYRRREFVSDGQITHVFIFEELPQNLWIEELVAGYKEKE
jgi:hypothetical protein